MPTGRPTYSPTDPTMTPTSKPTKDPTIDPTKTPTKEPTNYPSNSPSMAPTASPLWVNPCLNDPCTCDEDPLCSNCSLIENNCDIDGCEMNSFKIDTNFPCSNCKQTFGIECNWCRNYIGCMACRYGYTRVYDSMENLYYCKETNPIEQPEPTIDELTYRQCQSNNCINETNEFCNNLQHWGCVECMEGYWRKSNDHICVSCYIIPYCLECNSQGWGGCKKCQLPYKLQWDPDFGYKRCLP